VRDLPTSVLAGTAGPWTASRLVGMPEWMKRATHAGTEAEAAMKKRGGVRKGLRIRHPNLKSWVVVIGGSDLRFAVTRCWSGGDLNRRSLSGFARRMAHFSPFFHNLTELGLGIGLEDHIDQRQSNLPVVLMITRAWQTASARY
jgi:hypothetical protein